MGRIKYRLIVIWVIAALLGGCATTKPTATENSVRYLASLYNPSQLSLHPDYSIYHESDLYSVLYIRAYPAELRFSQTNEEAEYRALLSIKYRLIQLDDSGMEGAVVDSASVTYKLEAKDEKRPAFFASLSIPVNSGKRYLLRLQAQDLNRGSIGLEYLYIDKTNPYGAQNFKVVSLFSGYPKFMRFFMPGEKFNVRYRDPSVDSIHVQYFRLESELPRPPITATIDYTMNFTADTSFVFPLVDSAHYDLIREGMYFVRVDKEQDEGLTLFNFGGSFPDVKTSDELMEPLFYLATLAEYRDLRKESNRKLAVDDFWLKRGNSVEKSKELIRIYYNRVVYSNLYFTSNKEGWKTDRGMIFILFGPPSRIQMTGTGERWYYFARRKSNPVEFRFNRQSDAFSYNHLKWSKTTESQVLWNEAVRSWRNGKVYSPGS
ncbi:MAG: GWxTD domain-containing protein [Bacteroidales bacterium]|nr:GWxTD domain-containing protein [Bacteroidales bacterium]